MIDIIELGEQIFEWCGSDGRSQWYPIDRIKRAIIEGRVSAAAVAMETTTSLEEYREHLAIANDVDPERAAALTAEEMEEPPMAVAMPDRSTIIIDGSHRLWRALGEKIDGKREQVIIGLVDYRDLEREGLVLDQPDAPVVTIDPRGYDAKQHHAAAMRHFVERYSKAKGFRG